MADADCEIVSWEASACEDDHVHIEIRVKERRLPIRLMFEDPDHAYAFSKSVMRAFDDAIEVE